MEKENEVFVLRKLSHRSSYHILADLFVGTQNIENKMLSIDSYDKSNIFILGELKKAEFELFIILHSLLSRVRATRKRIDEMYLNGDESLDRALEDRAQRLHELEIDYSKVQNRLYGILEDVFKKQMEELMTAQTKLLKSRYFWSEHGICEGYDFVVFKERKLGVKNIFSCPGD